MRLHIGLQGAGSSADPGSEKIMPAGVPDPGEGVIFRQKAHDGRALAP